MRKSVALTCPTCHYDLTGLADSAECPECGFVRARHHAMQRHRKRERAPVWNVAFVASGFFAIVTAIVGWIAFPPRGVADTLLIATLLCISYVIILFIGLASDRTKTRLSSASLAWCTIIASAGSGAVHVAGLLSVHFGPPDAQAALVVVLAPMGGTFIGYVLFVASLIVARCLERIHSRRKK